MQSKDDSLRELNSRLIAEIDKLRRENVNIKAENTRLKQAIEENVKYEAEYEIRIKKLEQNISSENLERSPQDNSSKQIDLQCDETPVYNIVDNASNFDEFNDAPDSNISDSCGAPLLRNNTFSETKPYKNKEIKFLERVHKEHISNEIRERNQKNLRSQDPILKPSDLSYNDQNLEKAESRDCVSSEQNTETQEIKESEIDIQPLIQELFLETSKEDCIKIVNIEDSISDSTTIKLVHLFKKISLAEINTIQAKVEEIRSWYKYRKHFEKRLDDLPENKRNDKRACDLASGGIYDEMLQYLSGISHASLRKRTQRTKPIYKLFSAIREDKIS
ncbi:4125_t:CDS:2 [Cetraspora pellucida]|uniref:4125_t:CDS:1 n=1 Tax=Cetraspora pellucida TaxID=1433469 RepID=A0ACA9PL31_9GLOM|nr:4125_t:CDS:2 [Cetraspora pellucida]